MRRAILRTLWLVALVLLPQIGAVAQTPDALDFFEKRVHVHDLQATIMQLLGFDHTRLTYRHAGRDFRLTDVHGHVVHELIA